LLSLEVSNDELMKRLLLRGKDSGRPDDQNPEIINKRIEEYNAKTKAVAEYYKTQQKLKNIKGIGTVDEIFNALCAAIDG
jgi:adenylate kinase